MDSFPVQIWWMANLFTWAVVAAVVSRSYNSRYAEANRRYILSFSPSGPAFGMWFAIWAAVAVSLATQATLYILNSDEPFAPAQASALLSFAFAAACLWAPFFSEDSPRGYWCAAAALVACAALALTASILNSAGSPRTAALVFLVHPAFSLMAGWSCLACCLSVGIALRATTQLSERGAATETQLEYRSLYYDIFTPNADFPHDSTVVPLLLSAAVGSISVVARDPLLPVPVAWGIYFMHPSCWNGAALVLLVAAVVVAAVLP